MKDYQWPSSFANQNIKYNIQNEKKISHKLISEIEGYFQTHYNNHVVLWSSSSPSLGSW